MCGPEIDGPDISVPQKNFKWLSEQVKTWLPEARARSEARITQLDTAVGEFVNTALPEMGEAYRAGVDARQRYQNIYAPIEDKFARDAANYDTPQRREAEAARRSSEVASNVDKARQAAIAQLEGYGISPNATRTGALDLGARIQKAVATAQAANEGRQAVEDTGAQRQAMAIQVGQGVQQTQQRELAQSQSAGLNALGALGTVAGFEADTLGTPVNLSQLFSQVQSADASARIGAASGAVAAGSAAQQPFSDILGAGSTIAGLALGKGLLSDVRTKNLIRQVGIADVGVPVYEFTFKHDPDQNHFIGVLAQDLLRVKPEWVARRDDGLYYVDYSKLSF